MRSKIVLPLALLTAVLTGCSDRDLSELELAPLNTDPVIFDDTFGAGVDYHAFLDSKLDAVTIETRAGYVRDGDDAALRVTVPGPGSSDGWFAGGAFVSGDIRDLSGYDAVVFWARSEPASTLNVAGLANNNLGTSRYTVERHDIALDTTWQPYTIPIPDPSRLTRESGMFFFAEGYEGAQESTIWFDEIRFARVGTILDPRPVMNSRSVQTFVGKTVAIEGAAVTFAVNGADVTVTHMPGYFDFLSSDEGVVLPDAGAVRAVGEGTATVSARLGAVDVAGTVACDVIAPPPVSAPAPSYAAGDVVALFSDAYANVPVDTWRAGWSQSGPVEDLEAAGDAIKAYTSLIYAGIEFTTHPVDASAMTHVRMDVWARAGSLFRLKLVDFGANGVYGGGDDAERELVFHASSDPAFVAGQWVVLDIPLTRYTLPGVEHLAQVVISSSDARTVFIDNVLFHR